MKLLFLAQRRIFQRALASRQSAAMRAVNQSVSMQILEILADRNLRCCETLCQVEHQHAPFPVQDFEDRSAALFVEQRLSRGNWRETVTFPSAFFLYRLLSFVQRESEFGCDSKASLGVDGAQVRVRFLDANRGLCS